MQIFEIVTKPLGFLLVTLYSFIHNYGLTLIVFTFLVKLIILPLTIKQQKSMAETQKIQPLLAEIQAKYKTDKTKLNEETMKLYKEHNVNPAGGCLPLLIQMPIIISLYWVITQPLTYMFGLNADQIASLKAATGVMSIQEIDVAKNLTAEIINNLGLTSVRIIDFNFLGLDLGATPSYSQPSVLWIIPILAAASTYFVSKLSAPAKNPNAPVNEMANSMATMNKIFPLMTAWFTFSFPAGVGLYWVVSNGFQILQQYALNIYLKGHTDPLVIEKGDKKKLPKKGA